MTSRVVVSWLRGGLGNQMFEYAVGRAVALRQERALWLDDTPLLSDPPGTTHRDYCLDIFDIKAQRLSGASPTRPVVLVRVVETSPGFHPEVLAPSPYSHIYLQGFWQDPRYFADIETVLRNDFAIVPGIRSPAFENWHRAMARSPDPVCVHVRRRDYLTTASGARLGFVGEDYYKRAIAFMSARLPRAEYFVFSDDIAWCREALRLREPHFFVSTEYDPRSFRNDFELMASCRHFIIANSTFSWWAAWLGGAPGKIVLLPETWARNESLRPSRPDGWVAI